MKKALPLFLLVGAFLRAHAVEPLPLAPAGANATAKQTTITRNDGGTLVVPLQLVEARDANAAAKVSAVTQKTNLATTVQPVPAIPLAGRRGIAVQNQGPNDAYCCLGSSCTPAVYDGLKIAAGGGFASFEVSDAIPVRCLAQSAAQVDGGSTISVETR